MTDKPKMTEVWIDGEHFAKTKEWVGLTDKEIDDVLWKNECDYLPDIIRIVEAKLKDKNT